MGIRNEDPLKEYRQGVEKLARNVYLQAVSIKNELNYSKINPEDKYLIILHTINILTKKE